MIENKHEPYRAYVVEDNRIVSLELQEMLKQHGFTIVGSSVTGKKAVKEIIQLIPDFVLMDIMLEGEMDGIEAAREIKKKINITIIFTTAYSDDDTLTLVKNSNSDGYVLKPYDYKELFTTIDLTLKKHELQKEIIKREKKYRMLFEESHDAIFIIDDSGIIVEVNRSFRHLFGYDNIELDSVEVKSLFKDKNDYNEIEGQLQNNSMLIEYESVLKKKNGTVITCLININAFEADSSNFKGYQGIIRDITFQRRAEMDLKDSLERYEQAINGIIKVIALTLEARDPYTAGHQKRVSIIAQKIAEIMGLPYSVIRGIGIAGEIHDIGKISVPSEILTKPGRLSSVEFDLIKVHPETGFHIIKDIEFPWPLAEIIHQHHERIDGSGYPKGLQSDSILMESKIICVADVFEAMSSHRPYRPAIGFDKALEEINNQKGVMFENSVVDACNEAIKRGLINEELFHVI